jgi:hypothetical protein
MRALASVTVAAGLAIAAPSHRALAAEREVSLKKRELAALLSAIDASRRVGYSHRGKQVVIEDAGNSYHVTFMEDPIDVRFVGGRGAICWQIRKRDARVIRELLVR